MDDTMHLVRSNRWKSGEASPPTGKALLINQLNTEIAALRAIRQEMRRELYAAEEPMPELVKQIRLATAGMKERYREVWYLREKR